VDVTKEASGLQEMLKLSGGKRQVPVIVEGDKVTVGYGGT
jgi:glutaredoxin